MMEGLEESLEFDCSSVDDILVTVKGRLNKIGGCDQVEGLAIAIYYVFLWNVNPSNTEDLTSL